MVVMCSTCRKREAAVVVVVVVAVDVAMEGSQGDDDTDSNRNRDISNHPKQTRGGGGGSSSGSTDSSGSNGATLPLCLLHYYASGYARLHQQQRQQLPQHKIRWIEPHAAAQRPDVQRQFAMAFVDLQSEIQQQQQQHQEQQHEMQADRERSGRRPTISKGARERSATIHNGDDDDNNDPLSVLHQFHGAAARGRRSIGGAGQGGRAGGRSPRAKASPSAASGGAAAAAAARIKGPPYQHLTSSAAAAASGTRRRGRNGREWVDGGGFLTKAVLPDRIERTQLQQAELYRQMEERVNAVTPSQPAPPSSSYAQKDAPAPSATKRRRPSRKSIWNAVLETDVGARNADAVLTTAREDRGGADAATSHGKDHEPANAKAGGGISGGGGDEGDPEDGDNPHGVDCAACGSRKVRLLGTRGGGAGGGAGAQDQIRGEIWGNKDRNDQKWCRYQCLQCGRLWNEEE
jgi:hypothetical protein